MKVSATKTFTFDCAHYLENYEGACANMHGHTYKLEVTVRRIGKSLDEQQMVMDFSDLKKIVQEHILDKWDHATINEVEIYNPTAENMAIDAARKLKGVLYGQDIAVERVRLYETPTSYVEVVSS